MNLVKKFINNDKGKLTLAILSFAFFYLWDLGNIDGIRQGTEGFYLKISSEMFEKKSFITPLYYNLPHWSKPPLHFWLPMPFYFIMGGANLLAARLAMVIVSFGSLWFICQWLKRHFQIAPYYSFIFFASSIGFLKYSRVFMMEIPLSLLSVLASMLFYDYLLTSKRKFLVSSSLLLGLSILIKGPVSLVMCLGGVGTYLLIIMFKEKRLILKKVIIWSTLGVVLSSIWFIACYLQHGQQFLEYFFLRENLGKFTAQSYPIRVVFQGLLIYGLPWSLFAPTVAYFIKRNYKSFWNNNQSYLFLICNFLFFFFLWLVPNQRSHHYAIPSLPFFLSLILITAFPHKESAGPSKLQRSFHIIIAIGALGIMLLILPVLSFDAVKSSSWSLFRITFTLLTLLSLGVIFIRKSSPSLLKFHIALMAIGSVWVLLIPSFYLPLTPTKVIKVTHGHEVAVSVRKPYFVEEALQRKVTALDPDAVYQHLKAGNNYYIVHESLYHQKNLKEVAEILERWPVWQRGRRLKHIHQAISAKNIGLLQENMLLLRRRSLD